VCDTPCAHEVDDRDIPGAYVKATINNPTEFAAPVCDACVKRYYPGRFAEVEAERAVVQAYTYRP
jgi:hypothetical protein